MALEPGDRLGAYEITGKLGAGGMGVVLRARDTTLGREVALKVLPDEFIADPERRARFDREAKVLASLNHPNIGGIHGVEDVEGGRALVLELVEGPTLADRIAGGPLSQDEALAIAAQIAEALEAAHEQGIIHRDLKPANVKVRPDGAVKVLDFGLARALAPAGADASVSASPTISLTAAATQIGTLIGTAAYMSPEQASGKPADKRTDVWAFGVVLYEMLTGRRAFEGPDVSERGTDMRLTFERDPDMLPTWTPDGQRIALGQPLGWKAADGTGAVESLSEQGWRPQAFTPDGRTFVVERFRGSWGLGILDLDEGGEPSVLLDERHSERNASLSPDGRWMAYQSDENGDYEV